jgi:serine/threonine protein kinase/tetratricopeptide (TPR) repeat protein
MQNPGALPIQKLRDALGHSYTIDRELGKGGMATVYLAQDGKHDRVVALKVLHPDLAASLGPDRFLREIKLAARLNHPHILPLFDSGEAGGFLYYVMPYVEGESLREKLDREQQLPIEEAVHHGRAIASALDYAHRQGIVHRDIKPENVMLYEGEAMVMDFGIAKAVSAAGSETLTQTGMMVGTPAYVSPEQAAGETNLDGRSDQYSLACVVYEMITGERPFSGATPQAIMAKRFSETPKSLRSLRGAVPESVEKAISRAMATDASGRYSSTAQFGQALASGNVATPTSTESIPVAAVSAAKSVAVLPFANPSGDQESEYFTDGMADEIINALSKIQSLRVASRTSSFAFKGKNEDIGEIGRKLKVSTVLEGSMRKMGNKLRITAQLINVADGYQLWSERYDREMEDVFAIQDDIAQAIVKALRVILTEGEKKQIEKAHAVDVKAYDFYLRGRQYFHSFRRKSLIYAREMFNRAIDIDPEYARAYAGVSDTCSLLYTYFDARESNLRQADTASRKAIELAPDLAEARVARGISLSVSGRIEEATSEFEQAMKLDPKLFDAAYWFARARRTQGEYEEAARLFERAAAIRPEDYQVPGFLAQVLIALGRPDEAQVQFRRQVRLVDEHLELNPDDPRACILGAGAHARLGDAERSAFFAGRAMAADPDDPMLLYNVACTYACLGRDDDSLNALEQAIDRGFGDKGWMEHDSDLDSVRDTQRYRAILQRM